MSSKVETQPAIDRAVEDGDDPPVRELPVDRRGLRGDEGEARALAQAVDGGLPAVQAVRHQNLAERALAHADLHGLGRQPEDLPVAVVADEEAGLRVEHAQALDHVAQRRLEQAVLLGEPVVRGGQAVEGRRQGGARRLLAADVGADAAVAREAAVPGEARLPAHAQPARAAVRVGIGVVEVAKPLAPGHRLAIGSPMVLVRPVDGDRVAGAAHQLAHVPAEEAADAGAQVCEAAVGVGLPEPVGGDLREIFQELCGHRITVADAEILTGMS
ncbi:hypothetical protein MOX02_42550 [Methylobacterium oxalidis]|uniref:Uncharacterized protein n=1 Tax=Methylobacterium oxalidis TaxID=944322 RepID=A0A512J8C9_9HYPH|nr:hypothetical protein MOX02_42550 [Methylobacterium oxalidis]GLS62997.1 hypothetical protein GCM10007888_13780 [Methylobacterium oxalidis]